MRSKFGDNEPQDVSYHGNAFLRLMGYIKPYWKTVALCAGGAADGVRHCPPAHHRRRD